MVEKDKRIIVSVVMEKLGIEKKYFGLLRKILKIIGRERFLETAVSVREKKMKNPAPCFWKTIWREEKLRQFKKLRSQFLQKTHMFSPEKRDAIAVEAAKEERSRK